jgi:hypothetical protein
MHKGSIGMAKFQPEHKKKPVNANHGGVCVTIPIDLQPQFNALLGKVRVSRSGLVAQMIRFALSNME